MVLPLQVALDVQVGERLGRLVLGLYGNVVPQTVSRHVCERVWGVHAGWLEQACACVCMCAHVCVACPCPCWQWGQQGVC